MSDTYFYFSTFTVQMFIARKLIYDIVAKCFHICAFPRIVREFQRSIAARTRTEIFCATTKKRFRLVPGTSDSITEIKSPLTLGWLRFFRTPPKPEFEKFGNLLEKRAFSHLIKWRNVRGMQSDRGKVLLSTASLLDSVVN